MSVSPDADTQRRAALSRAIIAVAAVVALIGSVSIFAPTARGPWIAGALTLPLLLAWPLTRALFRTPDWSRAKALFAIPLGLLCIAMAFTLVPLSYLSPSNSTLWIILGVDALVASVGLLLGLARQNTETLQRGVAARLTLENDRITEDLSTPYLYGMAPRSDKTIRRRMTGVAYMFFVAFVIWLLVTGGGPFAALTEPLAVLPARVRVSLCLGFITLPVLFYVLPATWRLARAVQALEAQAVKPLHWQTR